MPDDLVELCGGEKGGVEVVSADVASADVASAAASACRVWLAGGLSSTGSGTGGTVSLGGGAVLVWRAVMGGWTEADKGVGARAAQPTPMESESGNVPCPCRGVPNLGVPNLGVPNLIGVPSFHTKD